MTVASLPRKGSSKLFKGVALCPPIAPKTMISPNLEQVKASRLNKESFSSSSHKKRNTSHGEERSSAKKGPKEFEYFQGYT